LIQDLSSLDFSGAAKKIWSGEKFSAAREKSRLARGTFFVPDKKSRLLRFASPGSFAD